MAPELTDLEEALREARRSYDTLVAGREEDVRRAEQAAREAERLFAQLDDRHSRAKTRLAEQYEEALARLEEVRATHRRNPLEPPLSLDTGELDELRLLLMDLPAVWRNANVSPEPRKAIVRAIIKRIDVKPGQYEWMLQVHWIGGASTPLVVLTRRGVQQFAAKSRRAGLMPAEIADKLNRQGAVSLSGPDAGMPYTEASVRRTMQWARIPLSPQEVEGLKYLSRRYSERAPAHEIANELNARGLWHRFGQWTAARIYGAVHRLRYKQGLGVEAPPRIPMLVDEVRRLNALGLSPEEMTARLQAAHVMSRRRRPVTWKSVNLTLYRLGLKRKSEQARRTISHQRREISSP